MPHILNASACPAVQQSTGFLGIAASISAPNAVCAETLTGMGFQLEIISPHGRRLDDAANFGGACACAVLVGSNAGNELKLTAPGSGLLLGVQKGKAICGGLIELAADTTLAVPDATARVWIWLLQTKVLAYTVTTTPPAGFSVLIGSCVTAGGNITSVDTSGVLFKIGDDLVRYSADPGIPTDTPPALLNFTQRTAFGRFDWTGAAYEQVGHPFVATAPTSLADGMHWFDTVALQDFSRTAGATKHGPTYT